MEEGRFIQKGRSSRCVPNPLSRTPIAHAKQNMRTSLTYITNGFSQSDAPFFEQSEKAYSRAGISVCRAKKGQEPTCVVYKSSSDVIRKLFPPIVSASKLSVTDRGQTPIQVHLCSENWNKIPKHLGSEYTDLNDYRVALISHEFAHVLGHDHVHCACVGCPADVRQQPSRGLRKCKPTKEVFFYKNAPPTDDNF